mmetsp:Transcript_15644/g.24284  ORF Transcript_15644/g.24284 Transcript_15644/m.24284 type:complete len:315 (-) Transcript_15644:46-990(-)
MEKPPPLIFENSHDGGSIPALQMLVTDIFTWEMLYQISQFAIKVAFTNYSKVIINPKKANRDEAKASLMEQGPSYVVSFVHSMYVTARGMMHLYSLWEASNIDKLHIAAEGTYREAHLEVARTNILFVAYLFYDMIHILHQYPKLGGGDTMVHHMLFAFCSIINGTYGIMPFQFGWLISGELSTIFLNWRWFLLKSGRDSGSLIENVNSMFAASFFISRNVMYTAGIVHLYIFSMSELKSLLSPDVAGVPLSALGITCESMLLGWLLNLYWGAKILRKVARAARAGPKVAVNDTAAVTTKATKSGKKVRRSKRD